MSGFVPLTSSAEVGYSGISENEALSQKFDVKGGIQQRRHLESIAAFENLGLHP